MKKLLTCMCALVALVLANTAMAGGYQLYSESATDVLSLGGAAVARSGAASSAWYNPAATTTVDKITLSGGGSLINLCTNYRSSIANDSMVSRWRPTGFFYAIYPVTPDLRLNLSINAPYGMITQWRPKSQLSNIATYTSIRACYISPSIAYKVTDELSLAAGFNVVYGTARLANYINIPAAYAAALGLPDRNKLYMRADCFGWGLFASAYWKPLDDWAFGAHYQSTVKLDLEGRCTYRWLNTTNFGALNFKKGDDAATIKCPAYLALGVENSTFEDWKFMFDVVWTQWSVYKNMDIKFENYPSTGTKGVAKNPRNWDDVFSIRFGAEYKLTDAIALRGGYMYDWSGCDNKVRSPEMPDSDKQLVGLGIGYHKDNWGVDLSYAYVLFRTGMLGTNAMKKAGLDADQRGRFYSHCHVVSAALTLRF